MVIAYLKLYRLDAAIICFLSYMLGESMGINDVTLHTILNGALLSLLSMNFVYSFNSWNDRDIDAVNKPHRPLPSGKISAKAALVYCLVLFIGGFLFPILLDYGLPFILLNFAILLIGLLYSNPYYPFKKNAILANVSTSVLLVLPMAIGYTYSGYNNQNHLIIVLFLLFNLVTIPLKDIEDVDGDTKHNSDNWFQMFGKKILLFNAIGSIALIPVVFWLQFEEQLTYLVVTVLTLSALHSLFYFLFGKQLSKIYKQKILIIIVFGIIYFINEIY